MSNNFVIIFLSLLFSAFFSGMEIAFVSSNRLKIEMDKKNGTLKSKIIIFFTKHPGQYIATMLVGNNIALVIYGIFMAIVLEPIINLVTTSEFNVLLIQTIISTLIILITAEFLPKTVFRIDPNKTLSIFSLPVFIIFWVFYPITKFSMFVSNFLLRKIFKAGSEGKTEKKIFGKVDLAELIDQGSKINQEEVLDHEIKIFQNALDFPEVKIRECMVPRNEITGLPNDTSIEELKKTFIESGFSKILIYQESIDNIIGYVSSTELFHNPQKIEDILINITISPETMSASKLLNKFIMEQKSVAVVVDEFGGTAGMVTIEDIMEEIFGEIEDEHDTDDYIELQVSENVFEFSGRLEIDYINEKFKLNIPESDEYETLAGFIINILERIPNKGDELNMDNYHFTILKIDNPKLELVRLEILENN